MSSSGGSRGPSEAVGTPNPIDYEIILHRLWALGELGRQTLQRVSASPILVQGGECMSSFYRVDGDMTLACSGHTRFSSATSGAIKDLLERYDPSVFSPGDQIFFNDPYVAGSHTYDQMMIRPLFSGTDLAGWTASSSHTADVGGNLSGGPTEIFHEGIRIRGLWVVREGVVRTDAFDSITHQCRDPDYVGLDLLSRIAANNVCADGYAALVDRFGWETVSAVTDKIIADTEALARNRLRTLPDGTWRACQIVATPAERGADPQLSEIRCKVAKRDDSLVIDFAGTSQEIVGEFNSTLPGTQAHVAIALNNTLFWDLPSSDGRWKPVDLRVPRGTILNARFPAACNRSPWVGQFIVAASS